MPSYELTGTLKEVFDPQTFASGFTKRDFVVATDEDYPQDVKLECIKEQCTLLDRVAVGDRVVVCFRLRGNQYNGRYFVNLQAQSIEAAGAAGVAEAPSGGDASLVPEDSGDDPEIDF